MRTSVGLLLVRLWEVPIVTVRHTRTVCDPSGTTSSHGVDVLIPSVLQRHMVAYATG